MSLFLRIFQHLLPRSKAWDLTIDRSLRQFFLGLTGAGDDVRDAADGVWTELDPSTTTSLDAWEEQHGIIRDAADSTATRRADIDTAWKTRGGQDPSYIQGILRDAGFDVYVHDYWETSHPPYTPRDPRGYANDPLVGPVVASAFASQTCAFDGAGQACASRFLAVEVNYLVNDNGTNRIPPPIPADPDKWPHFIYIGPFVMSESETPSQIPVTRKAEFKRLCLKLCPLQDWIVLHVDYVGSGVFSVEFDSTFE